MVAICEISLFSRAGAPASNLIKYVTFGNFNQHIGMNLKLTQWTLFIDMLGYRDINGSINSEEKAKEFIAFMDANRALFEAADSDKRKEQYAKDEVFDLYKYYDIKSAFVSDSLIITYLPKEVDEELRPGLAELHSANALFIIAMRLQMFIFRCFIEKGMFLRGGVSNKYCYVKDNFAVGEGLIEAYLGESQIAINPRIVLHPTVVANGDLMEKIQLIADRMYGGTSIIRRDEDGVYFLDYLGYAIALSNVKIPMIAMQALQNPMGQLRALQVTDSYIRRHAEAIVRKLEHLNEKMSALDPESKDAEVVQSVIKKFIWLKNYHNTKIEQHRYLSKYIL